MILVFIKDITLILKFHPNNNIKMKSKMMNNTN